MDKDQQQPKVELQKDLSTNPELDNILKSQNPEFSKNLKTALDKPENIQNFFDSCKNIDTAKLTTPVLLANAQNALKAIYGKFSPEDQKKNKDTFDATIAKLTPSVAPSAVTPATPVTPEAVVSPALLSDFTTFSTDIKKPGYLKDNLSKIISEIPKLRATKEGENLGDMQNKYANALVNQVVASADSTVFSNYVDLLKTDQLVVLGSTKAEQAKNFNTLVTSELAKINLTEPLKNNLYNIKCSIEAIDPQSFKDGLKSNIDGIVKEFGATLLSIVELFGGKGKLKKFCEYFKIKYEDTFASVENLYTNTYALAKTQSDSLDALYRSQTNFDGEDRLSKNIPKCSKSNIQKYYVDTWGPNNFNTLDPMLVSHALKQTKISIPNLVLESGSAYGETQYKLNPNVKVDPSDQKRIIESIFEHSGLWNAISSLNTDLADSVYEKKADGTSHALASFKSLNTPMDVSIAAGAYLMKGSKNLKYTVSQTKMPYEKDHIDSVKTNNETNALLTQRKENFTAPKFKDAWKDFTVKPSASPDYKDYAEFVTSKIGELLANNNEILLTIMKNPILKSLSGQFILKHLPTYLVNVKQNTQLYNNTNRGAIDDAIAKMNQLSSPADPKNPPILNISSDNKFSISGSVIVAAEKTVATSTPATTQGEAPAPITKSVSLDFSNFTWLLPQVASIVAPSKPKSKTTPSKAAQKTK